MASTFKIIQAGKEKMRLSICLQKTLGDVFNDVGIYGTIYLGSKGYNYNIQATDNNRCFTYELDESYESEIGKSFSVQIDQVYYNDEDILNNPNLHFTTYNTEVKMDNVYGIAYDCR